MEGIKSKIAKRLQKEEEGNNWSDYLDYDKFYEPAEINNILLELLKRDIEELCF